MLNLNHATCSCFHCMLQPRLASTVVAAAKECVNVLPWSINYVVLDQLTACKQRIVIELPSLPILSVTSLPDEEY